MTTFISLGQRCEVAWQLRRITGQARAHPFDWLVTPLQSVAPMVEDEFRRMLEPDALRRSIYWSQATGEPGETILNTVYNVFLHHDFPREGGRIADDWRTHLPAVGERWAHLIENWRTAVRGVEPLTFVRQGGCTELPSERALPTGTGDFAGLLQALRAHVTAPFDLLFVDLPEALDSVMVGAATASDWASPDDRWKGGSARWDQALAPHLPPPDA